MSFSQTIRVLAVVSLAADVTYFPLNVSQAADATWLLLLIVGYGNELYRSLPPPPPPPPSTPSALSLASFCRPFGPASLVSLLLQGNKGKEVRV